ncbi:MAG: DUF5615 family PIN-like protein [Methylocystis sp.]|nr:DUF5615 family PIN-like protein [Methylocystis sp.]MCA3584542.1 DUF5615 family PIN-like protein [Methylocystis sp.]MCA3588572.1 DUF5615 family PIN-like protein [Methylocystis sp.]MCA3591359.1 DUF5615 family PIN-like protein [Methylocystis sp.]
MRFLVDAQLPRAICSFLAHPDHEALHVKDVLPLDAKDADIWRMAIESSKCGEIAELVFSVGLNAPVGETRFGVFWM